MQRFSKMHITAALVGLLLHSRADASGEASSRHHLRHARGTHHSSEAADEAQPPMEAMYTDADDIARFLEKRHGIELVPEGAKPGVDLSDSERRALESIFAEGERPDVFKHCVLVRDFATPLRVGSALSLRGKTAALNLAKGRRVMTRGDDDDDDDGAPEPKAYEEKSDDEDSESSSDEEDSQGDDDSANDDEGSEGGSGRRPPVAPPNGVLVAKGGVMDRDEAPDGKVDNTFLKVDMVAYLASVAGEVPVIPRGVIAKWSSKRKVPIAGYLCTGEAGSALYTLPTPCLATSLDKEGMPDLPPGVNSNSTEGDFEVYVGSEMIRFTTKRKAEKFCHRLARQIAEDPGDNEWDTDKLKDLAAADKKDMKVSTFVQLTRKDPPEAWTTGNKKVLVIVMDWAPGDNSKAPITQQTLSPQHYRDRIFPRVQEAFKSMSFGKFSITYDVVPEVIRYAKRRSNYAAQGWPFPALYNGATESLAGNSKYGNQYNTQDYDLVYTISPQQAPVGTKGVAWVGAKGAMCNGCEAISENFQVMVAVHELGHNLGLSHAGSSSLEYGNPFDWMGNYPDVQGLSYGMGYKLKLHWLPRASVPRIDDAGVTNLNDRFVLLPFDISAPGSGQVMGIQLSLKKNNRDVFISYRKTTGREAGVYVVLQDKDKPDSQLIDMGCHTPSQKDARMQEGWTYIDPTNQVVIKVEKVTGEAATVHLYRAPSSSQDMAAIRARDKFSDGNYKCPRTCTDSDLLVSQFNGCGSLSDQGYCASGAITMGGTKYSVKTDLCPQSCNECASVMSGSTLKGGGCADRNVKISGMSCPVIAAKGHCEATTNIGHVGRDLCPMSCGFCPKEPSFSGSVSPGSYSDPSPARTIGGVGAVAAPTEPEPDTTQAPEPMPEDDEDEEPPTPQAPSAKQPECEDDASWRDEDGHGCRVYSDFISEGKLTQREACNYGTGEAEARCKKTCGQCNARSGSSGGSRSGGGGGGGGCTDDASWRDADGDGCSVYADYVRKGELTREFACSYGNGAAAQACKATCDTCEKGRIASINDGSSAEVVVGDSGTCEDKQCVTAWLESTGECFSCSDWASRCGEKDFSNDCPKTCGVCTSSAAINDQDGAQVEELADDPEEVLDPDCQDDKCIDSWLVSSGECFKCEDFAADYCGNDIEFMKSCPRSCKICVARKPECRDDFKPNACKEYKAWGWCSEPDLSEHCEATCGICGPHAKKHKKAEHKKAKKPVEEKPVVEEKPQQKSAAWRGPPAAAAVLAAMTALFGLSSF